MVNLSLDVVVAVMVCLLVLLLGLLAYLMVRKALGNRWERNVLHYEEMLRVPLYRYLKSGQLTRELLPHGNSHKFAALERLLSHYGELLSEEDVQQHVSGFAEAVFAGVYHSRLASRSWSKRMNTLYSIDAFRLHSFEEELAQRYLDPAKRTPRAEFELVLCILAGFSSLEVYPAMAGAVGGVSEATCREVLLRLPDERFAEFVYGFASLPVKLQGNVLDVIGLRQAGEWTGLLDEQLADTDPELRIRALKALGRMPVLDMRDAYLQYAESEHWQERMMAAKLYGVVRSRRLLPALEKLLADRNWWVRQQAAQAVLAYQDGRAVLERTASFAADRFAREVALEYLEKGAAVDEAR